jgi:hypothetical protein
VRTIQLAPDLKLPLDTVVQRKAIVAKNRVGKSNLACVYVEEAHAHDMHTKGRGVGPPRVVGERHPKATLTSEQVREIQRDLTTPQRTLASEYGVTQSTVWRIRHKRTRTEG